MFNAFIALIVCFSGWLIHQWSAAWAALENFLSLAHVGDCAFMALKIRISSATLLRSKYRSDVCFWGLPLAFGFAFHCLFYLLWELKSNLYSATERSMTASFNYLPLALISHSCSDLSWLLHPEHSGQFHGDANAAWLMRSHVFCWWIYALPRGWQLIWLNILYVCRCAWSAKIFWTIFGTDWKANGQLNCCRALGF